MNRQLLHTPEGVRDIYGLEYQKKIATENAIGKVMTMYGYHDIQTPTFEFFDIYAKEIGTTPSNELYKFFDKEGNTLVLRPDFTPSIARCCAKYSFLNDYNKEALENSPLRLQYKGNTFINTSNLQGKLKEVTQMGVELMKDSSVEADGEMIALVIHALESAGLNNFQISIGNVEYFKGLCEVAGLTNEIEIQLQQYISTKNYFAAKELLTKENIDPTITQLLLHSADLFGSIDILKQAKENRLNIRSLAAIKRLEALYEILLIYGVEKYISFDLGLLSQYQYYTGIIFKAFTYGVGDAIVKGGRYDHLIERFGTESAAIGCVFVIDDLVEALNRQKIEFDQSFTEVTLFYDDENFASVIHEANELRKTGTSVVVCKKN